MESFGTTKSQGLRKYVERWLVAVVEIRSPPLLRAAVIGSDACVLVIWVLRLINCHVFIFFFILLYGMSRLLFFIFLPMSVQHYGCNYNKILSYLYSFEDRKIIIIIKKRLLIEIFALIRVFEDLESFDFYDKKWKF